MSACKHGESGCGEYYRCGKCQREIHEAIWKSMTPDQKAYDRHVDPQGAYTSGLSARGGDSYLYEKRGCTCHINPPCDYCVNKEIP